MRLHTYMTGQIKDIMWYTEMTGMAQSIEEMINYRKLHIIS